MGSALIRLHGELEALVRTDLRGRAIALPLAEGATVKHAIEALDVPHTEVGAVTLDARPATLSTRLRAGAHVDAYPYPDGADACTGEARFLADAHLGALARRLRLLGFDTTLAGDGADRLLAELAQSQRRILLSRDRELLKHRRVERGMLVRALDPDAQCVEVGRRFGLAGAARPFSRCLECNGPLRDASPAEVGDRIPPHVARAHAEFTACDGCGRVYWPGSHWQRLRERARALLAAIGEPRAPPGHPRLSPGEGFG